MCAAAADVALARRPIDAYGLVHFTSAAGDALIAIALADSVFFSLPVDEAKVRVGAVPRAHDAAARPGRARCSSDPARPRRAAALGSPMAAALGAGGRRRLAAANVESLLLFPLALAILVRRRCTRSRRTASRWRTPIPRRG